MKSIQLVYSIMIFSFSCLLLSCESAENSAELARVRVSLVDAPADYDSVVIMIEDVQINLQDGDAGWTSLSNFEPRSYDLLKLTAGREAYLGAIELPEGHLKQIRLILGTENSLYKDGTKIPLNKINNASLETDIILMAGIDYEVIVDFDAGQSIKERSEAYDLIPKLSANVNSLTGSLEGRIISNGVNSIVYVIQGLDTASTFPNTQGEFTFPSISPGIYDVLVVPSSSSGFASIQSDEHIVSVERTTIIEDLEFAN